MKNTILSALLVLVPFILPAEHMIEGIINNENHSPLPCVSILVEGTEITVITDFDGKFALRIPSPIANISLQISYPGHETLKLRLTDNNFLKIKLKALHKPIQKTPSTKRKTGSPVVDSIKTLPLPSKNDKIKFYKKNRPLPLPCAPSRLRLQLIIKQTAFIKDLFEINSPKKEE